MRIKVSGAITLAQMLPLTLAQMLPSPGGHLSDLTSFHGIWWGTPEVQIWQFSLFFITQVA